MLFRWVLGFCFLHLIQCDLTVFEYGGVPGLKNGFYELSSNGTKTSEKSIAPLPSIFGGVNGASPCDDTSTDCLIFYGSIQYSSPNLVGNLFRFNFTSQSWTIFAKGLESFAINDATIFGDRLYLCGENLYEHSDPTTRGSVAYCIIGDDSQCTVLETKFDCTSIEVDQDGTIVVLDSSDSSIYNVYFKRTESEWDELFSSFPELLTWNNSIVIINLFDWTNLNQQYLCENNIPNLFFGLYWDHLHHCWNILDQIVNLTYIDEFFEHQWNPILGNSPYLGFYHLLDTEVQNILYWDGTTWNFFNITGTIDALDGTYLIYNAFFNSQVYDLIDGSISNFNGSFVTLLNSTLYFQFPSDPSSVSIGQLDISRNETKSFDLPLITTIAFPSSNCLCSNFITTFASYILGVWDLSYSCTFSSLSIWNGTWNNVQMTDGSMIFLSQNSTHLLLATFPEAFADNMNITIYNSQLEPVQSSIFQLNEDWLTFGAEVYAAWNGDNFILMCENANTNGVPGNQMALFTVDLNNGTMEPLKISNGSCGPILINSTIVYITGIFSLTIQGINYQNVIKYDYVKQEFLEMEGINDEDAKVNSVLMVGNSVCFFGGFDFFFGSGYQTRNIICADETGNWTLSELPGLPGKKVIGAIYLNEVTYIIDEFNELSYYDQVWVSSLTNIFGIYLWNSPSRGFEYWKLVVGVACGMVVLVLIVALVMYIKKRRNLYIEIPDAITDPSQNPVQLILDDPQILKIKEEEVTFLKPIGEGGQGQVYKILYNGRLAAAKSLPAHFFYSSDTVAEFMYEIKLASSLHHPNIIQFYGVFVQENRVWMIMEYMALTLSEIMSKIKQEDKRKVALGIATAMKYLHHDLHPSIMHRDLKPDNILLNDRGEVKIGDFGLGKIFKTVHNTNAIGTQAYLSPESLPTSPNAQVEYSTKVDVYAFGIVLSEIFGKRPFPNTPWAWQRIEMEREKRIQPVLPQNCPEDIKELILQCIETDPKLRPDFIEIISRLERTVN